MTIASTARIASAERRPARQASLYASSAASVVAGQAAASSSAASRSASETKGRHHRLHGRLFLGGGRYRLAQLDVRHEADVNVAISNEPASAVPREAPGLVIVF